MKMARSFKDLRIISLSVLTSAGTMFWTSIFIFITTFLFAIVMQWGAISVAEKTQGDLDSNADREIIKESWNTTLRCMLSLFMAASGGKDWADLTDPFYGEFAYYAFLVYLAFFMFIVTNVVTLA